MEPQENWDFKDGREMKKAMCDDEDSGRPGLTMFRQRRKLACLEQRSTEGVGKSGNSMLASVLLLGDLWKESTVRTFRNNLSLGNLCTSKNILSVSKCG
jgi:hypothetical protein